MQCARPFGCNANFGKPQSWDESRDGECGTLPLRCSQVGEYICHYSIWKPSERELEILKEGGFVALTCVGLQPPVAVGVTRDADG